MVFKHHHASSGYFYHGAAVIWLSIERGVGVKWEWKWGGSMSLRLCSFQGYGKYGLLVTPRTIIFLFPLLVCIGTITQPMCMFHGLLWWKIWLPNSYARSWFKGWFSTSNECQQKSTLSHTGGTGGSSPCVDQTCGSGGSAASQLARGFCPCKCMVLCCPVSWPHGMREMSHVIEGTYYDKLEGMGGGMQGINTCVY